MKKSVFGIAKSQEQANRIVDSLQNAGFTEEDVSVLFADPRFTRPSGSHREDAARLYEDANPRDVNARDVNARDVNARDVNERDVNARDANPRASKKTQVGIEKGNKSGEGAAIGATAGGVLGGTLGLLAGLGTLAIPGIGPFLAAGPILAALSGSAIGGSLGLIAGGLTGMGIPEYEAKRYEGRLKTGGILISVHCENNELVEQAKNIMKQHHAEDVACSSEKAGRK